MLNDEKEKIIKNNLLMKIKSGSHLYGLNNEDSDEDYLGVFFLPLKYLLGFDKCNKIDLSVKDKLSSGKNSKYAIDEIYYSLHKFVEFLIKNSPNSLELIFGNDYIYKDKIIDKLFINRKYFLSKNKIQKSFIGYAKSQKNKMEIKSDNLTYITNIYNEINNVNDYLASNSLIEIVNNSESLKQHFSKFKISNRKYIIGSRKFSLDMTFKKFKKDIKKIYKNKSSRYELVKKYGYDVKFASHYIRLISEGIELLETSEIKFPLYNKDEIMNIKNGKYSLNKVLEIGDKLTNKIKNTNSVISNNTRIDIIENILLDFYKQKFSFK